MYIHQKQLGTLISSVEAGKVVVVYGPRRCGKTTMLGKYIEHVQSTHPETSILSVTGEDRLVREYLESESVEKLRSFVGTHTLLIVDEAQKAHNIGLNLKLIVDHLPGVSIIATGSSSFDLAQKVGEPLTGRKTTLTLFPLSQMEIGQIEHGHETAAHLEDRLLYGSYPDVVLMADKTRRLSYLNDLLSSYLFKDILELDSVRNSAKLEQLLRLVAFQIGKEVSLNELGTKLGMSKNTVEKYLDLLEKSFVLYRVSGFSRNLRKEVTKMARYYFYDNGVRNALIQNFNPLSLRDDVGMLWENYLMSERMKKRGYADIFANQYFWRTYDQKEIDLVEERDGALFGYEFKWRADARTKEPRDWRIAYPGAHFEVIHPENYLAFIV